MGRYMTVVLKEKYQNDFFIELLNMELATTYGANSGNKFNTWAHIKSEAHYMNHDPEGLQQLPHWERPITAESLHKNFFWLRMGEYSFKLSCPSRSDEARDAVAICKWIIKTKGKFINKHASDNYYPAILREYLDELFLNDGYDLALLWTMPQ